MEHKSAVDAERQALQSKLDVHPKPWLCRCGATAHAWVHKCLSHTSTHICVHVYTHVSTHVHMPTRMSTHMPTRMSAHVYMQVCLAEQRLLQAHADRYAAMHAEERTAARATIFFDIDLEEDAVG